MKRYTTLISVIVILAFVSGCTQDSTKSDGSFNKLYKSPNKSLDPRCKWDSGPCEMIIDAGYYYNGYKNKCDYFPSGSGCSNPPFASLEECKSACE